ncbi:MAG: NRDE family protein [Alphaproteobacteria bacterium]
MCTVVLHRRPGHDWPLIIAANRDEMKTRLSRPPGRHWPDRPEVRAGLDVLAGGSWMGVNDWGVTAAILNRENTLGPEMGKRSRGELVLDALDHPDAFIAAQAFADLNPDAYRPFNMIIADSDDAYWVVHRGDRIRIETIRDGLSMITARDLNDMSSPRLQRFLPLFSQAAVPDPDKGDWSDWQMLMASPGADGEEVFGGMCFSAENGFGTVSSSLLALPSVDLMASVKPVYLHADGPPDNAEWAAVED